VKKHIAQYLNELLSIAIMLLMVVALLAGRATPLATGADDGSDPMVYRSVRAAGHE